MNVRAFALLLLFFVAAQALGETRASVDRQRLELGESLELRIRIDSTVSVPEPDLTQLERDFEIVSTSRNARFSLVNGRAESYTEWLIALMPLRAGTLQIPAIRVAAEQTTPITIEVRPSSAPSANADREIFLELEVDPEQVHVQQQLLLTVRVLHAINLNRGASLGEPVIENAVIRQIGEGSYEKSINGRPYGVFERRYAVFPQASGELLIPPIEFQGSVGGGGNSFFDAFGSRARAIRLRTPERRIQVQPPQTGADPWLPARMLSLVETWDREPSELRVGESATRTLTINAEGLTGAQLPALEPSAVDGLRFYPDQPETLDEEQQHGITGTRVERSAVIPLRAGTMELPELRLRWWDTRSRRFEDAVVPARSVRVLPAIGAAQPPPAIPAPASSDPAAPEPLLPAALPSTGPATAPLPWMLATAVLAMATLISTALWLRLRRRTRSTVAATEPANEAPRAERELIRQLRTACGKGDARAVQQLLPRWMQCIFARREINSLAEATRAIGNPELDNAVQEMLASCYGPQPLPWDGSRLLTLIEALRDEYTARRTSTAVQPLVPLYQS